MASCCACQHGTEENGGSPKTYKHDHADDAGSEETGGVVAQAQLGKDEWRVVEDGVDTWDSISSPLPKSSSGCK